MLLGYDKEGNIKFIFTDENYLKKKFPNNTAKISNFWKMNHNLKELFINDFSDIKNIDSYQVKNNKLEKKEDYIEKISKLTIINHIINKSDKKDINTENIYPINNLDFQPIIRGKK